MNADEILLKVETSIDYEWRREISRNEQLMRDRGLDECVIDTLLELCRMGWREAKARQLGEVGEWLRGGPLH